MEFLTVRVLVHVRCSLSTKLYLHNSHKRDLAPFAALRAAVRLQVLQNQAIAARICIAVNRAEYRTAWFS